MTQEPPKSCPRGGMLKKIVLVLVGLFLVAQVVRPDRTNPAYDKVGTLEAAHQPPAEVLSVLKRACFDCHSRETKWPWYTNLTPVSWFVADHVKEGREHVDFSILGALPKDRQAKILHECEEEVEEGHMPIDSYVWLHSEAKLSDADRKLIVEWFGATSKKLK